MLQAPDRGRESRQGRWGSVGALQVRNLVLAAATDNFVGDGAFGAAGCACEWFPELAGARRW